MTLAAGARIGSYEILGLLGAGGMGEVYLATGTRLQRRVERQMAHGSKALRWKSLSSLRRARSWRITDNPDLYKTVEDIANQHLGFARPRREFSKSMDLVQDPQLRERIETTANEMQST